MAHPATPACLTTPYSAKPHRKGGTLIAEDVITVAEHRKRLAEPDSYRPEECGHCAEPRPHAHDYRERVLRGDPLNPVEVIRRYLCTSCGGVWQVLPAFIARYLHRRWEVVQSMAVSSGDIEATGSEHRPLVPERTARRWSARLQATAVQLTQLLAGVGQEMALVVGLVGLGCRRAELVDALAAAELVEPARKLEQVAGWVHRLEAGIRLM